MPRYHVHFSADAKEPLPPVAKLAIALGLPGPAA
jgi:hypothetical protein